MLGLLNTPGTVESNLEWKLPLLLLLNSFLFSFFFQNHTFLFCVGVGQMKVFNIRAYLEIMSAHGGSFDTLMF